MTSARRARRAKSRRIWVPISVFGLSLVVLVGAVMWPQNGGGERPVMAAPPVMPSESAVARVTPEPTPTPTATPTATPPVVSPYSCAGASPEGWQFSPTYLSIHTDSVNIEGQITPYGVTDLTAGSFMNSQGEWTQHDAVDPADEYTLAWDASNVTYGNVLSSQSDGANAIYGHSYGGEGYAIFNDIPNLVIGDIVTIWNAEETMRFRVEIGPFDLHKGDVETKAELDATQCDTLLLITCNRDGVRDATGHAIENTAVVLRLIRAAAPPEQVDRSSSSKFE